MLPADAHCGFNEFNRRAGDFAMAMALGVYRLEAGKMIEARLAVGGAEVNPRRIAEAERALSGAAPGDAAFRAAAQAATAAVESDGGQRHHRRIPPRPRARGNAPGAGAGRAAVSGAFPTLSSSAKADDPVEPTRPAITGCPACAGHDSRG